MIISEKGINSAVFLIDPCDKTSNMDFEYPDSFQLLLIMNETNVYPDSISITTHDERNQYLVPQLVTQKINRGFW
jgi:hypothetical protein